MASVDNGFCTRRGGRTASFSRLGVAADFPVAGQSTSQVKNGLGVSEPAQNRTASRRGSGTRSLTALGIAAPFPSPGRATSQLGGYGFGNREPPDHPYQIRPVRGVNLQVPHTGTTAIYKIQGLYLGAYETWVSTSGPFAPPPSGHAVTDVSFTVTFLDD